MRQTESPGTPATGGMDVNDGETKTSMYRRAVEALGVDVDYDRFAAYCREEFGIDASRSGYYDAKKYFRESPPAVRADAAEDDDVDETPATPQPVAVKPTPETPAASSPSESGLIRVADLPSLMEQARALVAAFGGDKDALAKFIRLV